METTINASHVCRRAPELEHELLFESGVDDALATVRSLADSPWLRISAERVIERAFYQLDAAVANDECFVDYIHSFSSEIMELAEHLFEAGCRLRTLVGLSASVTEVEG